MIKPVSNYLFLVEAQDLYREFWDTAWQGHQDKQICNFDGSVDDLDMLGYCEYELGFPEENYSKAAIIWANVIRSNSVLDWGQNESGEIFLHAKEEHMFRYSLNIEAFVLNFIQSGISQFESFDFLTEKVLIEMFVAELSAADAQGLLSIVKARTAATDDTYSSRYAYAVREVYGEQSALCRELSNVLMENV